MKIMLIFHLYDTGLVVYLSALLILFCTHTLLTWLQGILAPVQALLSQSCSVRTAFRKHGHVCVLMPPCWWERTWWEDRAESGGHFVLTQDSG